MNGTYLYFLYVLTILLIYLICHVSSTRVQVRFIISFCFNLFCSLLYHEYPEYSRCSIVTWTNKLTIMLHSKVWWPHLTDLWKPKTIIDLPNQKPIIKLQNRTSNHHCWARSLPCWIPTNIPSRPILTSSLNPLIFLPTLYFFFMLTIFLSLKETKYGTPSLKQKLIPLTFSNLRKGFLSFMY